MSTTRFLYQNRMMPRWVRKCAGLLVLPAVSMNTQDACEVAGDFAGVYRNGTFTRF